MFAPAREVRVSPEQRSELEARVRAPTSEQRDAFRARIVLMVAEGRSTRALQGASFTSPQQVRERSDAFVESYNARAKPFSWTAATVHQKQLGTRVSHP